ncbi:MAG: alanyl-tRNA editing protein [Acidimicrobiia bacterium]|nr:alanyl-tRNA editing protein [Acidimicrobiia bacterium]MDX2467657.1 alanyl-tRNA editing protein [Acidimicrobiia bacterium]
MTEKIYSTQAYAQEMEATVVATNREDNRVLLDRTVFYPGGGGQPHDTGSLWLGDDRLDVVRVTADGDGVWHWLEGSLPGESAVVRGALDWDRRYKLMRTHTAMHAMCGVVWSAYQVPVTGGNMEAGEGRLDFELPDWNSEDRETVEAELNAQLAARRAVEVSFLPREEADQDPSLIRTKVSLLPAGLREVRVIDIVGLDRQADGGTHVDSTGEVGSITLGTVKSKGRGFRRFRFHLND